MEPLMEAPRLERKLVAILTADVEGYSRHMEQDEVATLAVISGLALSRTPARDRC
jgi:class 3 adenylate cyclase